MQTEIDVLYGAAQAAERAEQRRYEIARECLVGLIASSHGIPTSYAVVRATQFADALLAELGEQK